MKKKIKRAFCLFLYWTGVTPFLFWLRYRQKNQILVLLYHRIQKPRDPFEVAVSPAHFEGHLRFLEKYFQVISTNKALTWIRKKKIPEKPLAVITFDDGYRDNLETAYPLLKKYSLPATIFLAVGSIGNEEPMWTSRVETLFRNARVRELSLQTLSAPRSYELGDSYSRMKVCEEVKKEMKGAEETKRQRILEELREKMGFSLGGAEAVELEMLSWEEVRRLARDPLIEIGSHSVSHRMLAHLAPEEIPFELEESKRKIESEIGREIHFLSYPNNSYNANVQRAAEKAGYEAAFAVGHLPTSYQEDLFELKRILVEDDPLYVFQAEISLFLESLRSLFRRLFQKRRPHETKNFS